MPRKSEVPERQECIAIRLPISSFLLRRRREFFIDRRTSIVLKGVNVFKGVSRMGVWLKTLFVAGVLGVLTAGCDLGPTGTPPPLSKTEATAVLNCQSAIKFWSSHFVAVKIASLGDCANKILALQVQLENGLITQAQFDQKIAKQRSDCDKSFKLITQASTDLANQMQRLCKPQEDLIISSYDPLQFVVLGSSNPPGFLDPINSVDDILRYECIGGEIFADTTVFYQIPRLVPLLDSIGVSLEPASVLNKQPGDVGLFLDDRCFNGFPT
jgi:hypothetical protein